jgi:hypothetical protein
MPEKDEAKFPPALPKNRDSRALRQTLNSQKKGNDSRLGALQGFVVSLPGQLLPVYSRRSSTPDKKMDPGTVPARHPAKKTPALTTKHPCKTCSSIL